MNASAAQSYLDSFINHEKHLGEVRSADFKLDRVRLLLEHLGNPQKHLKIIHVAGSKGKGSICAITASILKSAGYKVGLYTSPHIEHCRERIRLLQADREAQCNDIFPDCISETELDEMVEAVKPAVEKVSREKLGALTFFEVYTALALYYFHRCNADLVILETGLGGRLDATNVTDSMIAVIAPISLEHTSILGDTIEQIAQEKAAIVKDGRQKVVIAPQAPEVRNILKHRCNAFHIIPLYADEHARQENVRQDIKGQAFDLITVNASYVPLAAPLLGKHQRGNVAVSVCIAEILLELGFFISVDAVHKGCADVFWPGRMEVMSRDPLVLIDGAHNEDSARALSETVTEIFKDKKVILILGMCEDKNKEAIRDALSGIAKEIIVTKADHPRAADLPGAVSVKEALTLVGKAAHPEDIILVTGSIFVASEARKLLTGDRALGLCPQ